MKTYIKTTWNWFRLLALASIMVCANNSRANSATTPTVSWPSLSPITYPTPLGSPQLRTVTKDPDRWMSLSPITLPTPFEPSKCMVTKDSKTWTFLLPIAPPTPFGPPQLSRVTEHHCARYVFKGNCGYNLVAQSGETVLKTGILRSEKKVGIGRIRLYDMDIFSVSHIAYIDKNTSHTIC